MGTPVKPPSLTTDLRVLPSALAPLLTERRWVVWRWEHVSVPDRWTKVPYQAHRPAAKARSNDPSTWSDHRTSVDVVGSGGADGIGFMLKDSGFGAFDIDNCRNRKTGGVEPWVWPFVERARSYAEVTISGSGIRIIGLANGPCVHRNQKVWTTGGRIETYRSAARYIVITGQPVEIAAEELANLDWIIDETVQHLDAQRHANELSLPRELEVLISEGAAVGKRSDRFHHAVGWLKDRGHSACDIEAIFKQHPRGIGEKYAGRLRGEIERSYAKSRTRQQSSMPDSGNTQHPEETLHPLSLRWHGEADQNADRAWLVRDLIPEMGKGLLSGQWGSAKTFAALDLSACVMSKQAFAGRVVQRQGGVLFVAAEGAYEIPVRLRGIAQRKIENVLTRETEAEHLAINPERMPFAWAEECPPILSKDGLDLLLVTARTARNRMAGEFGLPLALIVIDTIAAAAGFNDENAAAENQRVMARIESLSRQTGAFVLGVDHFGKIAETGTRGSSAKEAAADVVLAMLTDRDIAGNVSNTRMAVRKLRGGITGEVTHYSLDVVPIGVSRAGEPITTCVVVWNLGQGATAAPSARDRWPISLRIFKTAMQTALAEHGQLLRPFAAEGSGVRAVTEAKVRAEFMASYPVEGEVESKRSDAKRKAFRRALKSAIDRALVVSREQGGIDHLWFTDHRDGPDIHSGRTGHSL